MAPATSDTHGEGFRGAPQDPMFDIAVTTEEDGGWTVVVVGELDLSTAPRLREVLRLVEEEMGDSGRPVAIDLSRVSFIDSTALGIIVAAHKRYEMLAGSGLLISASSAVVTRVIEISGLNRLLKTGTATS
jgi:anti-sigma B factor antagonist